MATRKEQAWTPKKFRTRINAEKIRQRLEKQALGELEEPMTDAEIRAGIFLIEQAVGRPPQAIIGDDDSPPIRGVIELVGVK